MESKNKELTSLLYELAALHEQRRIGYEKASMECRDSFPELRTLFGEFADESQTMLTTLQEKLQHFEADTEPETGGGDISRIWEDVKWTNTKANQDAILESAQDAEKCIHDAYDKALADENAEMSAETRQLLIEQKEALEADAGKIDAIMHGSEAPVK